MSLGRREVDCQVDTKTRGREGLVTVDCVPADAVWPQFFLEAPVTTLVEVLAGGCASGFFSSDSSGK